MALGDSRPFGRQRRERSKEARSKRYTVKVTAEERVQLEARAAVAGVGVPELLFDAAMNTTTSTSAERAAAIAQLYALRKAMATSANNINQLARFANTEGAFPAEAEAAVREYRELLEEIKQATAGLAQR